MTTKLDWLKTFLAKADCSGDDCWEWPFSRNKKGYGQVKVKRSPRLVHRIAYEIERGQFSNYVLHRCDNPRCFRPSHLFIGTQADNIKDMKTKGRMAVGERMPQSKLTVAQVMEIKNAREKMSQYELALKFNVHQSQISKIQNGKRWKHINADANL